MYGRVISADDIRASYDTLPLQRYGLQNAVSSNDPESRSDDAKENNPDSPDSPDMEGLLRLLRPWDMLPFASSSLESQVS